MAHLVKGERGPARTDSIEPDESLPRACVIGAGSSGITAAKALHEARVPFDCFEIGSDVGGNWVFNNSNGQSACYSTLEMNTSGPRMAYSDFPFGNDDYPMHGDVRGYFDDYVDHFAIRDSITFGTRVDRCERLDDGWEVAISGDGAAGGSEVRTYDALVVCNGHHWDKRWPEPAFPGSFDGEEIHGHDYRGPELLEGRRVVVVGGGNSAMDVARDASHAGEETYLSMRRGVWVLRKRIDGKPVDQTLLPHWLPRGVKRTAFEIIKRRSGDPVKHGLPKPDHKVGNAHPTLSDQIYDRLAAGAVTPKPNIAELRGGKVAFTDGTEVEADLIVYCTGYKVTFPFFDDDLIAAPANRLDLYRRTFMSEMAGVYFVGLMQPLGAIMPIAEEQGRWIAAILAGRCVLPSDAEMRADIARERAVNERYFYDSDRHTMEVDFDAWLAGARRERERGIQRVRDGVPAAFAGKRQAVPA